MIGSILLTAPGRILLFDAEETLLVNQTFPKMEYLPVKSGMSRYQTARMAVINDFAYIGGRDGAIYLINLPIDNLDARAASTGTSSYLGGKYAKSLNVFNITLPYSCIVEVFTYTQTDGVIAACFNHTNSTLYVVNIHSPSRTSVLKFTPGTDFSNVLPVGDVFYFVQYGQLFRVDITREETSVEKPIETLKYCGQAWLEKNEGYAIIIDCRNTSRSIVYVPQEWSNAYEIKRGGWVNENVYLSPCYDTYFVFSVDKTTVTLYDVRNDFKTKVTLTGNPDSETLRCSRNGSNLVLMNHDKNCDCWKQHSLTEQYLIETPKIIPYSEGTLLPLAEGKNIRKTPLLFRPTKFLLPAEHQLFFDPHNNIVHPKITDDIVVFHAGIPANRQDDPIVKPISKHDKDNNKSSAQLLYVLVLVIAFVLVAVAVVVVVVCVAVLVYKKKRKKNKVTSDKNDEGVELWQAEPETPRTD